MRLYAVACTASGPSHRGGEAASSQVDRYGRLKCDLAIDPASLSSMLFVAAEACARATSSTAAGRGASSQPAAWAREKSPTAAGRTSAALASGSSNRTRAGADWPAPVQLRSIP